MYNMQKTINMGYMIFLSVVAAIGGLLFGYDTAVISGTISQVTEQFQLDSFHQGWYVGCALIGSIFGVLFAGALTDRWGRKPVMVLAALLFAGSGLYCAFAPDFMHLVMARIVGGIGIGVVSIVSPLYISEVAAAHYRGRLVSLYQVAVTVGFLGAYIVNYALLCHAQSGAFYASPLMQQVFVDDVWRAMLGMNAVPAIVFLVVIFFIPESPRWLIVFNRDAEAQGILTRIYASADEALQQVDATKAVLADETKANWRMLLQPGIRAAVVIGVCIAMLGQFMGVNAVLYYGPSIFEDAGLSSGDSLFYQILVGAVNTITGILALLIIDRIGRKHLIYYGVSGMIACLLLIGTYFTCGEALHLPSVMLLVFFLLYVFFCAGSISAVIFVLLSEMYPTRVRGLAMSIAGLSLWVGTYLIGQLTPWMLETLTPGGTFFFFAVMCVPYMLIVWRLMPETAGKTLEDIERFWTERK